MRTHQGNQPNTPVTKIRARDPEQGGRYTQIPSRDTVKSQLGGRRLGCRVHGTVVLWGEGWAKLDGRKPCLRWPPELRRKRRVSNND